MTIKPFFKYIAFAVISGFIAIFTLAAVQLVQQFADLVAGYASGITRLLP